MPDPGPPPDFKLRELPFVTLPADRVRYCIFLDEHPSALGYGQRPGRFSDGSFGVVSLAANRSTAFVETILRDRGDALPRPAIMSERELRSFAVAQIVVANTIRLLDLRRDRPTRYGIPTNVPRGRNHDAEWALALHDHRSVPDGVAHSSRFTLEDNLAVCDRGTGGLAITDRRRHVEWPDIGHILDYRNVALVE